MSLPGSQSIGPDSPAMDIMLEKLYGHSAVSGQRERWRKLDASFREAFPSAAQPRFFSAPGRVEIGGNHTDHQGGRVLAAAVDFDTIAAAAPAEGSVVRVRSEGYEPICLDLSSMTPRPEENGTSAAIIRGVAARMAQLGMRVGGFSACITSTVPNGSGLSSSAAFEVLVCTIFDSLFNGGAIDPILRAQISQYAENNYFGKPSGLMDQAASSEGGLVGIDFASDPVVRRISYDFDSKGYSLVIVSTGSSHEDLTAAYAAIPAEMKAVAACFRAGRLRDVDPSEFYAALPELHRAVSDRSILRAMHFFAEDARVPRQQDALERDDLPAFFREIIASGESSWRLLQNVWAVPEDQSLALALAISERLLGRDGAWRVHGGGFAGTILAFVPHALSRTYTQTLDAVFGKSACKCLRIRPVGACELV